MNIEQAIKNLTIVLESDSLLLSKKNHLTAQASLELLSNTCKEVEILKAKISELEKAK